MNDFVKRLKNKGYEVIGNKAVLHNVCFEICSGNINTARGIKKSYWLKLQ